MSWERVSVIVLDDALPPRFRKNSDYLDKLPALR